VTHVATPPEQTHVMLSNAGPAAGRPMSAAQLLVSPRSRHVSLITFVAVVAAAAVRRHAWTAFYNDTFS